MSSTLERLRRLEGLRPRRTEEVPLPPAAPDPDQPNPATARSHSRLEELVAGAVIENSVGSCFMRTTTYPLDQLRGPQPYGAVLRHAPALFTALFPNFALDPAHGYHDAVFLDTETTGLGGGAGVYAFMVGVGTFEHWTTDLSPISEAPSGPQSPISSLQSPVSNLQSPISSLQSPISNLQSPVSNSFVTHFVVRQYFMRHPGEEGALLLAVAELLDRCALSVTFNGRTFDLPLLRGRYRQNQRMYGDLRGSAGLLAPDRPHLDLLHPARRLWRRRLQSCRLINLEEAILGLRRTEADVPGHMIPQLYTEFVQSGNAGELQRVFYHNLEDILSMVGLATQLSCAFGAEAEPPLEREDWLAWGQCLEERRQFAEAEAAYRRAIDLIRDPAAKRLAFQRLGQLLKRQRRGAAAAEVWESWLTTVPGVDPTPYVELAKYCEWEQGDLAAAAMWTQWALHTLRTAASWQRPPGAVAELEHRLARLHRKGGEPEADPAG